MANKSLENRFNSDGSRLGVPVSPSDPQGIASALDRSTMHDQYSYDGNPNSSEVTPRRGNTGNGETPLPSSTKLQAFNGPKNDVASGAGFNQYNSETTYDDYILDQGSTK